MKSKSHHVYSRRTLLRGLGAGAVLLSPFVRHRMSHAQAAPAGNVLIFFTPNGHIKDEFDASGSGATFTLKKSLAPLESFKQDLTVIRGLTLKTVTEINSHDDIVRHLTCVEGPDKAKGYGPSLDHVIGTHLGQRPLFVNPEPNRSSGHWRNALSWRAAGEQEPFLTDPTAVFSNLFVNGTPTMGGAMPDQAAERAKARNKSILDFVNSDIQTFRGRINSEDKAHLDLYLDSLRDVEKRVTGTGGPVGGGGGLCMPDAVKTRLATLPATPEQNDDQSPAGMAENLRQNGEMMVDLIASAFACGTQRVASILWQGASEGLDPANNKGSPNHHSISHSSDIDSWKKIDTWYAERFAYTLQSLKKVNMLDKTIVVWITEIAQGHECGDFVHVVAGGQALGMKTQQHVLYPFKGNPGDKAVLKDPANKSLANLWVTVKNAMGVPGDTFGDPMWSDGPLMELKA
ncbi:MAG: hypothetical protein K0R38_6030 [Polyangiaceae bacterium]|jgi:hypothetical protein|nr:hypothetical protein [Polyangiaceae bacterium]